MATYTLYKLFILPVSAFLADRAVLHWLENIISHRQSSGLPSAQIFQRLYRTGELYAGFWGRSLSIAPGRVATICGFLASQKLFLSLSLNYVLATVLAGIAAGMIDVIGTCPGENARTRATFGLPRPRGFRENYRGFWALSGRCLGAPIILAGSAILTKFDFLPSSLNNGWCAGLITGAIAQVFSSPFDFIKNEKMKNLFSSYPDILSHYTQASCYYRGFFIKTLRMGLGSSIVIGIIGYFNAI